MIEAPAVGELYSNEEIFKSLGVANAGGIRLSCHASGAVARAAIMTSLPGLHGAGENPYHDRLEKNILTYTAEGKIGEQTLGGRNSRLQEQKLENFPIHGFALVASRRNKSFGPRRWKYLGLLRYLRHYPDSQIDANGDIRRVWIFEFAIHDELSPVPLQFDAPLAADLYTAARSIAPEIPGDDEIVTTSEQDPAGDFRRTEEVRGRLLSLEPRKFEFFVRDLLVHCGLANVCVTSYSADGGVDVNANAGSKLWLFEPTLVQIQAKRWMHSVGRREVAELRGSLQAHARGAIITTSHFSKAAIREAVEAGKSPIGLIDGLRLSQIVISEGITF